MITEKLELPFRQLLWILYNLRKAQKTGLDLNIKYWQDKADEMLITIGVDETTDFKSMQITFK